MTYNELITDDDYISLIRDFFVFGMKEEIARYEGINRQTIYNRINGQVKPTEKAKKAICYFIFENQDKIVKPYQTHPPALLERVIKAVRQERKRTGEA